MARDLSVGNFLRELSMRAGAAVVVVGIFVGLGFLNRTDLFGLSNLLGTQVAFTGVAFLLLGIVSGGWILFQRYSG